MKTPLFQYNPPGYERNMNKYSAYGRYGAQHSRPAAAGYFYDVRRKARKTCAAHNASGQYLLPYISQLPDQIPSFSLTSSMLRPLFVIAFSSSFSAFAFAAFLAFASAAFSAFFYIIHIFQFLSQRLLSSIQRLNLRVQFCLCFQIALNLRLQ